MKQALNMVG
jgi:hypothetical protein